MTWSYSGDPQSSTLDQVRFLVSDIDVGNQLLSDGEINFLLRQHNDSVEEATHEAMVRILGKLSKQVDYAIGPEKVTASQRFENYRIFYQECRTRMFNGKATPLWSGTDITDSSKGAFDIGFMDNPGGGDPLG